MTEQPTIAIADLPGQFDEDANEHLKELTGFGIGDRVIIRGGFVEGVEGIIVANEPDRSRDNPYGTDRPFRFRVRYASCRYCGDGMCRGSARTANGRDVENYHRHHTSGKPTPGTIGGLAPLNLEPLDYEPSEAELQARVQR